MTSEESRGRKITLGIALFLAVPSLLILIVLLLTGTPASRIPWFQVVLPVVMAFFLFKGYTWARAFIAFSSCAGALLLVLGPLLAGKQLLAVFSLPFAATYVAAAVILWKSKAVEAYFDRQTHSRNAPPSLIDHNDV
jgi:hypothetical protein